MTKGVFGRAPNSSRFKKTAPLQIFLAKHSQLQKLQIQKNLNLAPNSTKSMESLRGYSANTVFERTREVVWKLPTIAIVYTGYRFVFFFLSRSHLLPVAQTDRCPSAYLIAQPPPEKDRMSRPTSNPSARAGGQPAAAVGQPGRMCLFYYQRKRLCTSDRLTLFLAPGANVR